jgi:OOP family OmpA-OmpF porin
MVIVLAAVVLVAGCATQQETTVEQSAEKEEEMARSEETESETQETDSTTSEQVAQAADRDGDGVPDERDKCPGTPAGTKVDADGCAVAETTDRTGGDAAGENMSYRVTLLFDIDSASLRSEYERLHREAMQFAEENPGAVLESVLVDGHADSTGTEAHNRELSRERAQAVRDYLVESLNIDPDLITIRAFGELRPTTSNRTAAGRQRNRRVEVTFHGYM